MQRLGQNVAGLLDAGHRLNRDLTILQRHRRQPYLGFFCSDFSFIVFLERSLIDILHDKPGSCAGLGFIRSRQLIAHSIYATHV
jgi:hypothetical protein